MARRLTWLLTVPLMVGSLLAGHTVAYRLVDAPAGGHGYLNYMPLVGAVLLALAVCALVLEAVAVLRGEHRVSSPPLAFALLPVAAFVIQEHLEGLLYSGTSPLLEPAFLVGLAVQLPFGIVALLLARFLQSLARAVGLALALHDPPPHAERTALSPISVELRRLDVLALGYSERAPPLLALP
jgi:hypothetical protein